MRIPHLTATALAAVLIAAAPAAAAAPRSPAVGERIINGHAPSQAWPAQASVVYTVPRGTFVCGGVLVSARWILTAAHCATDDFGAPLAPANYNANPAQLTVGGVTRTGGTPYTVDSVLRDPDFAVTANGVPTNDFALLHLAGPVSNEPMRMITSASSEAALWSPGVQAKVTGWGVTQNGLQSATLLEAEVPIVSDAGCAGVFGSDFNSGSMVCAGGGSTDTCGGDSGGPLMVPHNGSFTVVGVTSWGADACGSPNIPGVYSRLGAPSLGAWVRTRVPTVAIAATPAPAAPGEQVGLSATVNLGAQTSAPTSIAWDLDDDGAFDDATGASTSMTFSSAGNPFVRVRATFADGDRAVTRDPVVVAGPAPQATPPAPAAPPAPPQSTPEQLAAIVAQPRAVPIGSIAAPASIRLATLRGSRGLRVTFTCRLACRISGRLTLTANNAKRYRLPVRTIASANGSLAAAGDSVMTVRISGRAKRALRRATSFTATLQTTLSGEGAATVQGTRKVTVRR